MKTDQVITAARERLVPICVDVLEIDYSKGGLHGLEAAKAMLEDALRGVELAIADIDAIRFNGVMRSINHSVDSANEFMGRVKGK